MACQTADRSIGEVWLLEGECLEIRCVGSMLVVYLCLVDAKETVPLPVRGVMTQPGPPCYTAGEERLDMQTISEAATQVIRAPWEQLEASGELRERNGGSRRRTGRSPV
jgi:hypothetical protein